MSAFHAEKDQHRDFLVNGPGDESRQRGLRGLSADEAAKGKSATRGSHMII